MLQMFLGLWRYRGFVLSSIRNDFSSRFARSRLGGLWMIINPLAQVAIYALILSNVLAAKLPGVDRQYAYALYLMAGMLGWSLFSETITRCLTLFVDQGNLMKKMSFPRITLPFIAIGCSLLNYLLLLGALLVVFAFFGKYPDLIMLWLIPLTLAVVALGFGIGLILGVLNVFVRDVGQVVPILLQVWFWFTPIVYPVNIVPSYIVDFVKANPFYALASSYHQILVYDTAPDLSFLWPTLLISAVLLALGLVMFRRSAPEMVDVL